MFDPQEYRARRGAGLRGQGSVYLRGTGAIEARLQGSPLYGPQGHKPVSKKAFKKNTRRARRYNRIEELALHAGN